MSEQEREHFVIVVGAGPAGVFLAGELAEAGVSVLILNRDIRPGGLVEYGIFPTKTKLKGGIRRQLRKVLAHPKVAYLGKVPVGEGQVLTLAELRAMKPSAIAVTTGAQGTKHQGLPGELRPRVYHAKDLVYHYTELPPFSTQDFPIGRKALVIGMGNVAVDIAHWLTRFKKVDEVTIMARRGPEARKYTPKEVKVIGANFDAEDFRAEMERIRGELEAVGQDVDALTDELLAEYAKKPEPAVSETKVRLRFLSSPVAFLGEGEEGAVTGVRVQRNRLVLKDGRTRPEPTGEELVADYDTVVFAIGDQISEDIGLPIHEGCYSTDEAHGQPHDVVEPGTREPVEGVFVAGWARRASDGLVGIAKQDGVECAKRMLAWLEGRPPCRVTIQELREELNRRLEGGGRSVVDYEEVLLLEAVEAKVAESKGLEEFQYPTDEAMFAAIERGRSGA